MARKPTSARKSAAGSEPPRAAGAAEPPSLSGRGPGRVEIDAFFGKSGKVIVALTVRGILNEELAKKPA